MRDILILRDPRESWKRCSLAPLRGLEGVRFLAWQPGQAVDGEGRLLLDPRGEELTREDLNRPLLLLDCSWRRQPRMANDLVGDFSPRRLPPLVTAYPRRSRTFQDPERGLASIEALYAFSALTGSADRRLLEGYRWAREFLAANPLLG